MRATAPRNSSLCPICAVAEERERIARIVDGWEPYAGVFSRHDLSAFIRRGDDL